MTDSSELRAELRRRWEAFLDGTTNPRETALWAEDQFADYGGDEIIHNGLQRLNGHSWRGLPPTHAAWVSYQNWLEIAHWYEDDPDAWNFYYWRGLFIRVIAGRHTQDARRISRVFADRLDLSTIERLVEIYAVSESSPSTP